jgi:hypothetical protein
VRPDSELLQSRDQFAVRLGQPYKPQSPCLLLPEPILVHTKLLRSLALVESEKSTAHADSKLGREFALRVLPSSVAVSGQPQVYVTPFHGPGSKWQVSIGKNIFEPGKEQTLFQGLFKMRSPPSLPTMSLPMANTLSCVRAAAPRPLP